VHICDVHRVHQAQKPVATTTASGEEMISLEDQIVMIDPTKEAMPSRAATWATTARLVVGQRRQHVQHLVGLDDTGVRVLVMPPITSRLICRWTGTGMAQNFWRRSTMVVAPWSVQVKDFLTV
jgi:hypothetical protein